MYGTFLMIFSEENSGDSKALKEFIENGKRKRRCRDYSFHTFHFLLFDGIFWNDLAEPIVRFVRFDDGRIPWFHKSTFIAENDGLFKILPNQRNYRRSTVSKERDNFTNGESTKIRSTATKACLCTAQQRNSTCDIMKKRILFGCGKKSRKWTIKGNRGWLTNK